MKIYVKDGNTGHKIRLALESSDRQLLSAQLKVS